MPGMRRRNVYRVVHRNVADPGHAQCACVGKDVIYRILKHLDLLNKDQGMDEVQVRGSPGLGVAQSISA